MLQAIIAALKGPAQARAAHRQALLAKPGVKKGIQALMAVGSETVADDDQSPIFLLSAGWRSGSTLLQRLVMSDKRVLIWGEPYDECGLIQALAEASKAFRPGWPRADYYYDGRPIGQLSGGWIANLFPTLEDWRDAHRSLFQALFARPARAAGAEIWGIKEVRLTAEHCYYLRWLYPNAKFVFLYRHPLDAYRSYCRYGRSWYDIYPDKPIFTPASFGRHWRKLMEGYLHESEQLGALLVRYEDLISSSSLVDELAAHLGIGIDHGILRLKVRNSDKVIGEAAKRNAQAKVSGPEKWLLLRAVSPLAGELGYRF